MVTKFTTHTKIHKKIQQQRILQRNQNLNVLKRCFGKHSVKIINEESDIYNSKKDAADNIGYNHYDVSLVYTKGNEKPFKDVYQMLAKKLLHVIDRRETYKIMGLDIIRNLESGITKYDSERQIKDKVKDLIEDAFSDDFTKKRFGNAVQTIHTKVNKKPNKRVILEVKAAKIAKNIKAMFKRIKMILEIERSVILTTFSICSSEVESPITRCHY